MRQQRILHIVLTFGLACLLQACSVPESRTSSQTFATKTYTVSRGDTLYAIAWKHSLDYRKLAQANGIGPPYTIYVGQTLFLTQGRGRTPYQPFGKHAPREDRATRNAGTADITSPTPSSNPKVTGAGAVTTAGVNVSSTMSQSPVVAAPNVAAQPEVIDETITEDKQGEQLTFAWPITGDIIRSFDLEKQSKGIDISGKVGSPVLSSQSGTVVYAGNGIKGYGNLIIIKHNDVYLSAYAHNKTLLINEGDTVNQGQKIALLGSSGTQSPKLHFEIRRYGKPIDPMPLLK